MPSTFNTLLEDKRISEIKNMTAAKNDGIPFLLLPVRTETRFMELDEPSQTTSTDNIDTILDVLLMTQVDLLDIQNLQQAGGAISRSLKNIQSAAKMVSEITILTAKNKRILKEMGASVTDTVNFASQKFPSAGFTVLKNTVSSLVAAMEALVVDPHGVLLPARNLLDRLHKVAGTIDVLSNRAKTPYQNIKNKKDLFGYVETGLDQALTFYKNQAEAVAGMQYIAKNQFTQLQQLHTQVSKGIAAVLPNLAVIHTDATWAAFIAEKATPLVADIESGIKEFGMVSLPAIKALPEPPQYDYNDLLLQAMKTYLHLKKISIEPASPYAAVSKFKNRIKSGITYIDRSVTAVPLQGASQAQRLNKVYNLLTPELSKAGQKIESISAKNKSQKYGIDLLSEYISSDAAAVIGKAKAVIEPKLKKVHELWVRIYPDDIFVHTHEEELTAKEYESGKRFWSAWWMAGNDITLEKAAWKRLCTTHGTKRASWIASLIDPRTSGIARNAQQLQQKPYAFFADIQEAAKSIPPASQSLNPTLDPDRFWTSVILNAITVLDTRIKKLASLLQPVAVAPDVMMQELEVQVVRAQGDIQSILSKTTSLTPAQQTQFADKLAAFKLVADNFSKLVETVNAIERKTIDQLVNELPQEAFDYVDPAIKEGVWTKAPHTYVLPERFAVITINNNRFQHIVVGNKVPDNLQLGPDPAFFSNKDENGETVYKIDENGDLAIEDGIKWMTEYRRAVETGMGVTIPLTQEQYDAGFDKLLVIGVKQGDAVNNKSLLEKLLLNHVYAADGMGILKVGTPTNNTENATAGYSARDNDEDERFDIEIANRLFDAFATDTMLQADGKRLADGLGLSADVLQKVDNRHDRQVSNAITMNRALWSATLGHTMEEMWDHIFTYDNIRRTEKYFINHCPARGILPSMRVGAQPYGILPTTAYSRFKISAQYDACHLPQVTNANAEVARQLRFDLRLHEILKMFNGVWTELRRNKVAHYAQLENGNPQQKFIEMLGLNAGSVEHYYRYGINITRKGVKTADGNKEYDIRATHGAEYMRAWFKEMMINGVFAPSFSFPDETIPDLFNVLFKLTDRKYSRIRDQFDQSRIFRNRFIAGPQELRQLTGYLIDSKELSPVEPVERGEGGSYIDWLLNSFLDAILAGNNPATFPSRSLLFLLMRQSLMQVYQEAALDILQLEGLITEDRRRIVGDENTYSEWGGMGSLRKYNTKWHLLLKDMDELKGFVFDKFDNSNAFYNYVVNTGNNSGAGRSSMATYIYKPEANPLLNGYVRAAQHKKILQKTEEVRRAYGILNNLPTGELSHLLAEHIDSCSYRLDAWMTGLVNRRLSEQRAINKEGIYLGAYGWLENLRRDTNKKEAKAADIPAGLSPEAVKVYDDPDNDGFIHAPSLNHAITAAVLRSAYKANYSEEDINNRLAVNISSSRVRMALNLIDGVQNGLQIGAILGFQFEKGIHERYKLAELDKFILPFRNAFPLVVAVKDNAQAGKPPSYNSNVVDGMALLNKIYDAVKWLDFPSDKTMFEVITDPANNTVLKWLHDLVTANGGGNTEFVQIAKEIDRMADALDALGDVAVSESVYQVVQGNYVRASAMMNSLAQGKNIPEPQMIDTPRSGTVVTQRVVLNFHPQETFAQPPGWPANATPRANAEPTLNTWLASVIGNPANIRCVAAYKTTEPDAVTRSGELALSELDLQPLDYLFVAANEADFKQYIAYKLREKLSLPNDATVTIDLISRLDTWGSSVHSFYEQDHLLTQLRNILLQARAAGAEQLVQTSVAPDPGNPGNHDVGQYKIRTEEAVNRLTNIINTLTADAAVKDLLEAKKILEAPDDTLSDAQLQLMKDFLVLVNAYGVPNAVPGMLHEQAADKKEASQKYLQQTMVAYRQTRERLKQATDTLNKINAKTPDKQKLSFYNDVLKIVFGKAFVSLPLYKAPNQEAISKQLAAPDEENIIRGDRTMVMAEWLQSVAKVRPKIGSLEMLDILLSAADKSIDLLPVQLNHQPGDYWLGVEFPAEYVPAEDKLSLLMVNPQQWMDPGIQNQAGIILDEWVEVIPNKMETTGIALNYNQPDAMPPQSLLLAVTPVTTGKWVWEDLVVTLLDTLEMAKNRAVEPDHVDQSALSHILPGILSEVAPPQMGNIPDANPLGVQVVMDFAFNRQPKKIPIQPIQPIP
ncbi:MAG: hypothetical protein KF862_00780 [Chitinophagaceae bacterium]|nr:hypothetical protein [Chitinophagaceae bacterium]